MRGRERSERSRLRSSAALSSNWRMALVLRERETEATGRRGRRREEERKRLTAREDAIEWNWCERVQGKSVCSLKFWALKLGVRVGGI